MVTLENSCEFFCVIWNEFAAQKWLLGSFFSPRQTLLLNQTEYCDLIPSTSPSQCNHNNHDQVSYIYWLDLLKQRMNILDKIMSYVPISLCFCTLLWRQLFNYSIILYAACTLSFRDLISSWMMPQILNYRIHLLCWNCGSYPQLWIYISFKISSWIMKSSDNIFYVLFFFL